MAYDLSIIDRYTLQYRRVGTTIIVDVVDTLANNTIESTTFINAVPGAPIPNEITSFGCSRIAALMADISLGGGSSLVPITANRNIASTDNGNTLTNNTTSPLVIAIVADVITQATMLQQENTGAVSITASAGVTFIGTTLATTAAGQLITILPTSTANKYIVKVSA